MSRARAFSTICVSTLVLLSASCSRESKESYLEKGNRFFAAGKIEDAALAYRKAIQKDMRFGEAHYRLGLAELAQGRRDKAYIPLRRAMSLLPDRPEIAVKLGEVYVEDWLANPRRPKELYDEIDSIANRLLARDPKSYDAVRFQARLALESGEQKKALELFEKANGLKPMQPETVLWLVTLIGATDAARAEELSRQLMESHPDYAPIYDSVYVRYMAAKRVKEAEQVLVAKRRNLPKDAATRLQLAAHYAQTNRPAEMKAVLDEMLANSRDFPDARLRIGDFYAGRGQTAEALQMYEQGQRSEPANKTYRTRIINLHLAAGRKDEAVRAIDAFLATTPNDIDARAARAGIWLDSGRPDAVERSLREFQELVKATPANPELRYGLGRAYRMRGDRQSAEREFREGARRDPNFIPARISLAEIALEDGRVKEALGQAADVLQVDSRILSARLLLVRALQNTGRLRDARKEMDLVLKEFPGNREVQVREAFLLIDEKKYKEAEALFARVFRPGQDDLDVLTGLAEVLLAQKQPAKALELVKNEVTRFPQSRRNRELYARMLMRVGDSEGALRQFRELIASGARSEQAYRCIAEIQFSRGQVRDAVESLRQAYALAPERADLAVLLGSVVERSGNASEAQSLYRKALAAQPQNAVALNNLAYNLAETGGDLDEAVRLALRASQITSDPNFADTLGWIYYKKKMHDNAVQVFQTVVQKQPGNATFRLHLGMALLAKGDRRAARQELTAALAQSPDPEEQVQIRTLITQMGS